VCKAGCGQHKGNQDNVRHEALPVASTGSALSSDVERGRIDARGGEEMAGWALRRRATVEVVGVDGYLGSDIAAAS
jgi:hypothetical protein